LATKLANACVYICFIIFSPCVYNVKIVQ